MDDTERGKVVEIYYLSNDVIHSMINRNILRNTRPADPARIEAAADLVRAELRWIQAVEDLEQFGLRARLSDFQENLLDLFISIGPMQEFEY